MTNYHTSVLLPEVIELLNINKGQKYIDATLGGGGHSFEIINRGGEVLGLDVDEDAINHVKANGKWQGEYGKLTIGKGNFKDIKKIAQENGFGQVAGIVFDLGVSSHQFDSAERGFSFRFEGPLDMRMDKDLKVQAKDLVNILTKGELYELFAKLGEEQFAHTITNHIISARRIKPFTTTKELADVIAEAVPGKLRLDTTARAYQALRIAINDELNSIRTALPQAYDLLAPDGRLIVISFHSLEDRIVKNQFAEWSKQEKGEILTKKPITPGREEEEQNKRSRSAKLRAFRKK